MRTAWSGVCVIAVAVFAGAAAAQTQGSGTAPQNGALGQSKSGQVKSSAEQKPTRLSGVLSSGGPTSVTSDESLFEVMAALNACGYDEGLKDAPAVRLQVRADMQAAMAKSPAAAAAREEVCAFVHHHEGTSTAQTLSEYVSLGLVLGLPPALETMQPIPALPPDAGRVVGVLPALRKFAEATELHEIWLRAQPAYDAAESAVRAPARQMMLDADKYLHVTESAYSERRFVVLVEPLIAPNEVNARVYGADYLIVLAPPADAAAEARFERNVRHFYLHYVIEPYIFGYPRAIAALQPLLAMVQEAPMEEVYRSDVASLVSDSFIRAVEARTMDTGVAAYKPPPGSRMTDTEVAAQVQSSERQAEAAREARVQQDMQDGFILTRYFYLQLANYQQSDVGLRDAIGEMVYGMNVESVRHSLKTLHFAARESAPELLSRNDVLAAKTAAQGPLDEAEQALATNPEHAAALAEKALEDKTSEAGRAMFIIARAEARTGKMAEAQAAFMQTLTLSKDPQTLAWAHVYLGRIYDLQEQRGSAVAQYKAALSLNAAPEPSAAAQKGLDNAFAPPAQHDPAAAQQ
jgi:tetratricopeptide (TPR) repeat protein